MVHFSTCRLPTVDFQQSSTLSAVPLLGTFIWGRGWSPRARTWGLLLRSSEKEVLHQNSSNLELLFQVQFLPKSAASLCAGAGHCLVSSPIPFLAGHSLPGRSARPGWRQGQHGAGAGGGGAAALEAAGAGAEEDGVRPAQDAELGPAGLCRIRTPCCWNGTSNPP